MKSSRGAFWIVALLLHPVAALASGGGGDELLRLVVLAFTVPMFFVVCMASPVICVLLRGPLSVSERAIWMAALLAADILGIWAYPFEAFKDSAWTMQRGSSCLLWFVGALPSLLLWTALVFRLNYARQPSRN